MEISRKDGEFSQVALSLLYAGEHRGKGKAVVFAVAGHCCAAGQRR
jgi:hypothetical protein